MTTPNPRFDSQVAIVTGAGSGLGRATALAFAAAGAKVVIGDIDAKGAAETERLAREAGGEVVVQAADVRSEDQVEALVATAVKRFGRLDVMVNNAGIIGEWHPIAEQTAETLELMLGVHVKGTVFGMKHALKPMVAQKSGVIVNMASVAAYRIMVPGLAFYSACKSAIISLTRSGALEYGPHGIRVVAMAPGVIETPMQREAAGDDWPPPIVNDVPMGRMGTPEDIATAILWLASDAAGYISGVTLPVDGAYLAP